jgi:hypothetical protein
MPLGWGVLAVPTGIVTAEITRQRLKEPEEEGPRRCDACGSANHAAPARYCRDCGAPFPSAGARPRAGGAHLTLSAGKPMPLPEQNGDGNAGSTH